MCSLIFLLIGAVLLEPITDSMMDQIQLFVAMSQRSKSSFVVLGEI